MPVVGSPITGGEAGWIDVNDAALYFQTRLHSAAWTASGSKAAALLTAQRDIEYCPDFTFTALDTATPSTAMKNAVCEQALFRLNDPDSDIRTGLIGQGVAAAWAVQEQYSKSRGATPICPTARQMLAGYLSTSNMNGAVSLYRPEAECPT